jgi:hypothetical protein
MKTLAQKVAEHFKAQLTDPRQRPLGDGEMEILKLAEEILNQSPSTPNGYDWRWVEAINTVLEERGEHERINDVTEAFWDRFIGPMCDAITDDTEGYWQDMLVADNECSDCGSMVPYIIGCPDGAEICQSCFDAGGH